MANTSKKEGNIMTKKVVSKKDIDYTIEITGGRIIVRMLQLGNDGRNHSVSAPYPYYERFYNEETGQADIKKLTKQQCINLLLQRCRVNASKIDR